MAYCSTSLSCFSWGLDSNLIWATILSSLHIVRNLGVSQEVNEMWAGLGYYTRARFLLEVIFTRCTIRSFNSISNLPIATMIFPSSFLVSWVASLICLTGYTCLFVIHELSVCCIFQLQWAVHMHLRGFLLYSYLFFSKLTILDVNWLVEWLIRLRRIG